jgi:hypothetical protein
LRTQFITSVNAIRGFSVAAVLNGVFFRKRLNTEDTEKSEDAEKEKLIDTK